MSKESPARDNLIRVISAKVSEGVRRHGLFEHGHRVVVGCSGGADSTCLLHSLLVGLESLRLECTAVYVDHGLRSDTQKEQELVRALADRLGASFVVVKVDVPGAVARAGGSIQDAARNLRYAALKDQAARVGAESIAVGHTQTDQAETVLLQLLRGAGSTGLSAMAPRSGMIVRPLLDIQREDAEAYCRHHNLEWFQDPSNESRRYMRSRIRHDLMPYLKLFNARIVEGLSRTADILRAEDEYLEAVARQETGKLVRSGPDPQSIAMDVDMLRKLPLALQRRVLRLVATDIGQGGGNTAFEHVEAMIQLIRSEHSGGKANVPGGILAMREYDQLILLPARSGPNKENREGDGDLDNGENSTQQFLPLSIGDTVKVPWADIWIRAEAVEAEPDGGLGIARRSADVVVVNRDAIAGPLFVRTRLPGDRIRPLGLGGEKKVKELMIDKKVPPRLRNMIPIICDQEGIVWVAGLALAERAKISAGTRRLIRFEVINEAEKGP